MWSQWSMTRVSKGAFLGFEFQAWLFLYGGEDGWLSEVVSPGFSFGPLFAMVSRCAISLKRSSSSAFSIGWELWNR
jgi:hypothetical protein